MIRYKTNVNEEKQQIAVEITLNSQKNTNKRKKCFVLCVIVGLIEIIIGLLLIVKYTRISGIVMMIVGVMLIILALKVKEFQRFTLRYVQKFIKSASYNEVAEYVFDDDGIEIISNLGHGKNYWDAFKEYGILEEYIYVFRKDNKMILINKNDLSKEEITELKQLLTKIKK